MPPSRLANRSRCPARRVPLLLLLAGPLVAAAAPSPTGQTQPLARTRPVVIALDLSGSMNDVGRLDSVKQAMKLVLAIFDGTVHLVPFAGEAQAAQTLPLGTAAERRRAEQSIRRLTADGGTNYLAALDRIDELGLSGPADVIFLSDGLPEPGYGGSEAVLSRIATTPHRLHTVAAQTGPNERRLLRTMAERTGGSALAVDNAEQLTTGLVELAFELTDYFVFDPSQPVRRFEGTFSGGVVLALAFDARVGIDGLIAGDRVYDAAAELPGEWVTIERITPQQTCDLTLFLEQPRSASARLAKLLRNDVRRHRPQIAAAREGQVPAGRVVEIESVPLAASDRGGRNAALRDPEIDYRLVRDRDGTLIDRGPAVRDADGRLVARLAIPNRVGEAMTLIQTESLADRSGTAIRTTKRPLSTTYATQDRITSAVGAVDFGSRPSGRSEAIMATVPLVAPVATTLAVSLGPLTHEATGQTLPVRGPASLVAAAGKPAVLDLRLDPAELTVGEYGGTVRVSSPLLPHALSLRTHLSVVPSLASSWPQPPKLSRGTITKTSLRLKAGGDGPNGRVTLEKTRLDVPGGSVWIQPSDGRLIARGGSATVPVQIAVGPNVEPGEVPLRLTATVDGRAIAVDPLPLTLTDGSAAHFEASPKTVRVTGAAGAIGTFNLTIAATAGLSGRDSLRAVGGEFSDPNGQRAKVAIDCRVEPPGVLTAARSVAIAGRVLIPNTPGTHRGELVVTSDTSGTLRVPIVVVAE